MRAVLAVVSFVALNACAPERHHTEAQWRACRDQSAFALDPTAACSAVIADPAADPERRALALVQRGIFRRDVGEYSRAVADFGRALRLDPRLASAYVERGIAHFERGAYDVAVRDYDAALAIDPRAAFANERRQQALAGRVDRFESNLALLDEALLRDPINPSLLNNRCWLRVTNDRDLDAALADCNAAIRINPRNAAALDSRGLVHLKRGEFAEAVTDYEAALVIEPGRGHYLYGRGVDVFA